MEENSEHPKIVNISSLLLPPPELSKGMPLLPASDVSKPCGLPIVPHGERKRPLQTKLRIITLPHEIASR